jgi:MOSC domain-containing protein YiiM
MSISVAEPLRNASDPRSGGAVRAIFVAPEQGAPMTRLERVRAVPGRGLEGDRYFGRRGRFGPRGSDVTLVEEECLEELRSELAIDLEASETRRNLVVRGLRLADLVGVVFLVGSVEVRGDEICEPCSHLDPVRRDPRVLKGLVRRGGLRASILGAGHIAVGDRIHGSAEPALPNLGARTSVAGRTLTPSRSITRRGIDDGPAYARGRRRS